MKRLAILAIIVCAWFHLTPAHAQFNGCSSFCGTSSSAIADAPGFNNIQNSGGAPALACTYTPVTSGTQNVAYTGATPSASGGVPAYTFSETGALPTGLSINTSTGVISGTPSVNGSFPSIQVKVTDTASTVANCGASFTLVINFQGPGDVVSGATGFWGLRAYNAAYATGSNSAAIVCDSATFTTCTTINILANGNFDTATASGSASCASACVVKSLTDQTGNGHTATCASASVCPILTFNCLGTHPCMQTSGSHSSAITSPFAVTTGWTFISVVDRTANFTSFSLYCCTSGSSAIQIGMTNVANQGFAFNGGSNNTFTIGDSQANSEILVFNGASSVAFINGTSTAMATVGTTGASVTALFNVANANFFAGNSEEFGIWGSTTFTPTQYGNMCHNQFNYWGTAVSC